MATTTGDPPPLPPTTTTTKPSTLTPLTRPTSTPPQLQPKPPRQFLHHPPPHQTHHHPYQTGVFAPPSSIQTQTHFLPHLGKPSDPIRYPLASSGRGLIPTHHRGGGIHPQLPESVPSYPQIAYSNHNSRAHPQIAYSNHNSHSIAAAAAAAAATASRSVQFNNIHNPLSTVAASSYAVPESSAPKDLMDKKPDDSLVTFRDREVRVSNGASLYALCRSWLRNGYPEDNQPQYGDALISLPKPWPLPKSTSPKRKERDDETEVDEIETDDILSAEKLLTMHVKRAKRIRARLREERSHRIERYKSRLALLLPPNAAIQE